MRNSLIGKAAKGFAAITAAALGIGLLAMPAANAAGGNPDLTIKDGSIIVHKYQEGTTGWDQTTTGDPAKKSEPASGKAVEGVTFEAKLVENYDLNEPGSWDNLGNLAVNSSAAGTKVTGNASNPDAKLADTVATGTTDSSGDATLSNLPVGLYYVVETSVSNAKIDGSPVTISKKAQPFFVTIPYPKAQNEWIYNVHVYPKNGTSSTTKDIDTSKWQKKGNPLTWTVTQDIPHDNVTAFGFVDYFDQNVTYSNITATIKDETSPLVAGTDYVITKSTKQLSGGASRDIVKIQFKAEGLNKLNAHKDGKVIYTVTATIKETLQSMSVPNSLYPIVNDSNPWSGTTPGNPETPPTTPETPPTPPVVSDNDPVFGSYQFTKVDDQKPAKPLTGATFGLFEKNANDECVKPTNDNGYVAKVETDSNGVVAFTNIVLGKVAKGTTPVKGTNSKEFCLVETVAPAGFTLNTEPVKITIDPSTTGTPTTGANFVNTKQTGPNLPLTGAAGKVLLAVGGVAVLMVAVGLYMVQSRRNKKQG